VRKVAKVCRDEEEKFIAVATTEVKAGALAKAVTTKLPHYSTRQFIVRLPC
jgi:hypothetical protein